MRGLFSPDVVPEQEEDSLAPQPYSVIRACPSIKGMIPSFDVIRPTSGSGSSLRVGPFQLEDRSSVAPRDGPRRSEGHRCLEVAERHGEVYVFCLIKRALRDFFLAFTEGTSSALGSSLTMTLLLLSVQERALARSYECLMYCLLVRFTQQ